jgi:gamma-tubulin complex component 5
VHRSILTILDLALSFSRVYSSHAGVDSDANPSDKPALKSDSARRKRLRKRHARLNRQNTIGFSDQKEDVTESSSSEDEIIDEEDLKGREDDGVERPSLATSMSFAEDSFVVKLDRMSEELEGQIRYVKKAVDVLGGGSGDVAATFGIFSFILEEWHL